MLLHKKITALCCIVFLLAGVGGYTADAAINTEVGSLSGDAASGAEEKVKQERKSH